VSLKPDLFEGLRFDFTKPFNQNFAVCHSFFMGNADVPAQPGAPPLKMAVGTYEFGANLVSSRGDMAVGRVLTDGRMTGRVKVDVSDSVSLKLQTQMSPEPGMSQGMVDVDFKGADWNGQVKLGNNQFYGE
jgi:mitochondrial import receptor subunit TOM40